MFSKRVTTEDAEELLRSLLNDDSWSSVNFEELTENEADIAETVFLSNFPEGTRKYSRHSKLARSLRQASDAAANDLGGKALVERVHNSPLGKFSGYRTKAFLDEDGTLNVEFFGKEQMDQGLTKEPALTFSVLPDGEIIVNGPSPLGQTFKEFEKRGWAEPATSGGEVAPGWTRLSGNLLLPQVVNLLGRAIKRRRNV